MTPRKYYRIEKQNTSLQSNTTPTIDVDSFIKTTKQLIQQNKYLYIDMNNQDVKIMNECSSSDEQQQLEKISKKYTINLNDANIQTTKAKLYFSKITQGKRKKQKADNMIEEELNRSFQFKKEDRRDKMNRFAKLIRPPSSSLSKDIKPVTKELNMTMKLSKKLFGHCRKLNKLQTIILQNSKVQTSRNIQKNNKWKSMSIDFQNFKSLIQNRQPIEHLLPHRRSLNKGKDIQKEKDRQAFKLANLTMSSSIVKQPDEEKADEERRDRRSKEEYIKMKLILPKVHKKKKIQISYPQFY